LDQNTPRRINPNPNPNHHVQSMPNLFPHQELMHQVKTRDIDQQMPDDFFKERKYVVEIKDVNTRYTIEENREMDDDGQNQNIAEDGDNKEPIKDRIHYHPSYNSLQHVAHLAAVEAENHSRQMSELTVNNVLKLGDTNSKSLEMDPTKSPSGMKGALEVAVHLGATDTNKTNNVIQSNHTPMGSGIFIITQNVSHKRRGSEVEFEFDLQKYGSNQIKQEKEKEEEKKDRVNVVDENKEHSMIKESPMTGDNIASPVTDVGSHDHKTLQPMISNFTDETIEVLKTPNFSDQPSEVASEHQHITVNSTQL